MFSAKRRFSEPVAVSLTRGPARVHQRRVPVPKASLLLAVLSAATASCALQVHEGDGLVTDGREIQISPSMATAARPGATGTGTIECKHLDLFMQTVLPLLTAKFQGVPQGIPNEVLEPQSCVSCHSEKNKAVLEMFMDPTLPKETCQMAYLRQFQQGDIIAASDPGMPLFEHEFKFQKVEEHNRFRDAVQAWINAEGIVTKPSATTPKP